MPTNNVEFDTFFPTSASHYPSREDSFSQQLNGIEFNPPNATKDQSRQSWNATAGAFDAQSSSLSGTGNHVSGMPSASWAPVSTSMTKMSMSDVQSAPFMASDVLDFGSIAPETLTSTSQEPNADFFPGLGINDEKPAMAASTELSDLDTNFDPFEHNPFASDENNTIINLNHFPASLQDPVDLATSNDYRRRSSSSFLSSVGPLNEPSELSYTSDGTPQGSLNPSSANISPVEYSRRNPREVIRSASRSRTTPSPRPTARAQPYPMDVIRENQTSTGPISIPRGRHSSPYISSPENLVASMSVHPRANSSATPAGSHPSANLQPTFRYAPLRGIPRFHQSMMPPSSFDPTSGVETVPHMRADGTFSTLQSTSAPAGHVHSQLCDHADPPDLFGSLSEEQLVPPLEDMKPEDPEMTPHEQEVRFEGDLYTPRFVRGHGNKREGWCGICKPGRWLVLKNSAYWYDKSFSHGVSAASGQAFESPRETRRMDGNADVWEGLCGSCHEWIALVSSKKKGTTWFRHAYKVGTSLPKL